MQYYFVKRNSQRVNFFTLFHSTVIHSTSYLPNWFKNFPSNGSTKTGITIYWINSNKYVLTECCLSCCLSKMTEFLLFVFAAAFYCVLCKEIALLGFELS